MKIEKDGNYFLTGKITYVGVSTFDKVSTSYERIELTTDDGEAIQLKDFTADAETNRVIEIGQRVTLYFTATLRKGAVGTTRLWAARDEATGRVFASERLGEVRLAVGYKAFFYAVFSPVGLLIFVIGMPAMLLFAWGYKQILNDYPTKDELKSAVEQLSKR